MGGREQMIGIPLASIHSDLGFTIGGSYRQDPACNSTGVCLAPAAAESVGRFALQVERVAAVLQEGAQAIYPDLAQRAPGLIQNRFDVYVVAGDEPGSTSSAAAGIGLANRHYALGELAQAEAILRRALVHHPDSVAVRNNLAHTLSDLGRNEEALVLIEQVPPPAGSPFGAAVAETRLLIVRRMGRGG